MSFQFQINTDVHFQHDEYLLEKARKYKPRIQYQLIPMQSLGKLVEDKTKYEGWAIQPIESSLTNSYQKDDVVIFDFGNHYVGKFSIDLDCVGSPMDAPLYLRIRFAEVPAELAHSSQEYDGWLARGWIQEEFVHLDTLPSTLRLDRRYACRYVEIKVLDTSGKWKVVFSNPRIESESSVLCDKVNIPEIKDEKLQKIYEVGLKTLMDCMQDVFEDGPKRDRRLWLGDLRLQALANYYSFRQLNLVKRCLYLFAGMPSEDGRISANVFVNPKEIPDDTFLFDYSLFFISVLYDYLCESYDKELLNDLFFVAKKQIDYAIQFVKKNGELDLPENYPVFVDWSNAFEKDTCAQGILVYVMKQWIVLCEMYGYESKNYKDTLQQLVTYALTCLYDTNKKLFVSKNGTYNIASQVWMVYANILTPEENKELMLQAIHTFFPIENIATPYMYHHITEALFLVGYKKEAITFMKSYWGKMIDLGADTYWEAFNPVQPNYSPYGNAMISSYCHAWSCTPVYLIQKYVLERHDL